MAVKPRSEWSEAYRKRIERAEARGVSRQQARGHKAHEHIQRKQTDIARGLLTTSERQTVRKFAREQSKRIGEDVTQAMLNWATLNGYEQFKRLRSEQRAIMRQYKSERNSGIYESRGLPMLETLADERGVQPTWYYYH